MAYLSTFSSVIHKCVYVGLKFRSQLLVHFKTVTSHQGVGVLVNILVSVMMRYMRTCCSVKAWFIKAITLQTLNDT